MKENLAEPGPSFQQPRVLSHPFTTKLKQTPSALDRSLWHQQADFWTSGVFFPFTCNYILASEQLEAPCSFFFYIVCFL